MLDRLRSLLEPRRDDAARLLLRVTLGGLTLFHGVDKLTHGLGGVRHDLASAGLPAAMAYGVYLGEVVAPILVLVGVWTRIAAVVLAGSILFATVVAHAHQYVSITPMGGFAAESYVFYVGVGCAIALTGAGRYAIRRPPGRWD
jgi:putative oxidoreductase